LGRGAMWILVRGYLVKNLSQPVSD